MTECWVGLVGPAMKFQEGNESSAQRAKRKLFRRTGKWCPVSSETMKDNVLV